MLKTNCFLNFPSLFARNVLLCGQIPIDFDNEKNAKSHANSIYAERLMRRENNPKREDNATLLSPLLYR